MRILLLSAALAALVSLAACASGAGGSTQALVPVGEPLVTPGDTITKADGRVKNTGKDTMTGLVTVTLFDDAGKIVAVCTGAVNHVPPGEEVTYTATGDKATGWSRAEVKVSTQFPG